MWFRKKPEPAKPVVKEPVWRHLGTTRLKWITPSGEETGATFIHFYANEHNMDQRKVSWVGPAPTLHNFYQFDVVGWKEGNNLYDPIFVPSDWLIEYALENEGLAWDQKRRRWLVADGESEGQPAEGENVIQFPKGQ